MRYPGFKESRQKQFKIPCLSQGIDRVSDAADTRLGSLNDSRNLWFKDDALKTRPTIANNGSAAYLNSEFDWNSVASEITSTEVYQNGVKNRLAYIIASDGAANAVLKMFLVSTQGEHTDFGEIDFSASGSEAFFAPTGVFFITGAATVGEGVYAFVTTASASDTQYAVYEHTLENRWQKLENEDCYIPIIYTNGRGTNYYKAVKEGYTHEAEPERPEELNMLTPVFKACFSADGKSGIFYLPVSNLDNAEVKGRIYDSLGGHYDWVIPAGQTRTTGDYKGNSITMSCNRYRGMVAFTKTETGEEFALSWTASLPSNGIVITASKSLPDGIARIVGSKSSIIHNSRIYIYGNEACPNEIYSARQAKPLYFPKNSKTGIGELNEEVCAMAVQNAKIIAFKRNEMYKINVSSGIGLDMPRLFEEDYGDPNGSDTLEAVSICSGVGCVNRKTLVLCGSRLIWVGADGGIYTLATTTYGNQNNVYKISECLGDRTAEIFSAGQAAFATCNFGYYMLFAGEKVFVMNHRAKSFGYSEMVSGLNNLAEGISWYIWKFPEKVKIIGATSMNGEVFLSCINPQKSFLYIATLDSSGEYDILLDRVGEEYITEQLPVCYSAETAASTLGSHHLKFIDSAAVRLKAGSDVEVSFGGDVEAKGVAAGCCLNSGSIVRVIPYLPAVGKVSLRLSGIGRAEIGEITWSFRERKE